MGNNRNVAFWVVLFLLIVVLFNVFSTGSSSRQSREVPFSEFVKNVTGGEIRAVTLDGEKVRFTGPDNREQFTSLVDKFFISIGCLILKIVLYIL